MNQTAFVIVFLLVFCLPAIIGVITFLSKSAGMLAQLTGIINYFFGKKPQAGRSLISNDVPIRPKKYSSDEIRKIMQGNYADLGRDTTTTQRFLLSEVDRCKNAVVLGPVGAGKSAWLTATTLASDIMKRGNSVFIFDATNDFTSQAATLCREYGRDLYIYPDIGFNPLNLVKESPQARAELFGDIFAQVTPVSDDARYFMDIQLRFLNLMITIYELVYKQPMILRELWELCVKEERRKRLINEAGAISLAQDYKDTFGSWKITDFDRNLSGLVNFIDKICSRDNIHFFNQRFAPTIEDIIEKKEVCVIRAGGDPGTRDHVRGLLFMVAIQDATKSREEDSHFLALYIDEFHRYLNPTYPNFIATSRKRRVAQILAFQSLGQLIDSKGNDYSNTIMSNARTCVVHTGLSAEDAEYIADSIGKRQFIYRAVGETRYKADLMRTRNANENMGLDYPFYPYQIRNLDQNTSLILSVKERGLDAPRLVEKPVPLNIARSGYKPPQIEIKTPPTIWDEPPEPPKKVLLSSNSPHLTEKIKEDLDIQAEDILNKARNKNEQKPQNPKQNKPRRKKNQNNRGGGNQAPKKEGEI